MKRDEKPSGHEVAGRRGRLCRRVLRWLGLGLLGLVVVGLLLWAAVAIYYADTHGGPRRVTVSLFAGLCLGVAFLRPLWKRLAGAGILFLVVCGWFLSLRPSDQREWAPGVARTPRAVMEGDRVTIENVRNFDYRSESDFTERWETRSYELSQLQTVDLMLVYWGSPSIAHAMVSFGFAGGQQLAISIETRKEKGERYSALQSFFRQYELVYVIGDERDLVRVRTHYRGEDVYLYRTRLTPDQGRAALRSYLAAANRLHEQPEWYNALTSNCATGVLPHARGAGLPGKWSWDIVLSGHAARQAYRNGYLNTSVPFEELRGRSHINARALAPGADSDFSRAIRAGLP